jgi:lysyl-tRNA synthetase class 2
MSGTIQIYLREDTLENTSKENQTIGFADLTLVDISDFIEVSGTITKTKAGEISILAKQLRILAKTIRPVPPQLKSKEQQFRRRYLDFNINPEKKDLFLRKSKFYEANRKFLHDRGFIEVETPVLEQVTGGADARPFVTHHHDLDQNFFLRISTELYQKRLIGGGFEKIFTIGPNFRNEGISDEHLQEFYQIEWYWAYADYKDNMDLVRDCFRYMAKQVYGTTKFTTRGHVFDLSENWQIYDYPVIIKEKFGVDIFNDSEEKIAGILRKHNVDLSKGGINRNRLIDNLWKLIRKTLSGPGFLINEPKFMSPLAKSRADNPELTERFHVVIAGSELGNGYSEINDPQDQLARFVEQQQMREAGDDEAQMLDIDFVEMLEYGMPPTSGYAHSERAFWFFENVTAREGTLFPQLKLEIDNLTRKIYKSIARFFEIQEQSAKTMVGEANAEKSEQLATGIRKQDFSKKMVLVLDEKLQDWRLTNTVGHLSAYLGNHIEPVYFVSRSEFELAGEETTPANSQYPIVSLGATQNQLHNLMKQVEEARLTHLTYIKEMIDTTNDEELQAMVTGKTKDQLEIHGIGIFGNKEEVDKLTKKFSLFKL